VKKRLSNFVGVGITDDREVDDIAEQDQVIIVLPCFFKKSVILFASFQGLVLHQRFVIDESTHWITKMCV